MSSTTYVDSVVYSMAGDPENIPDYLKSVVVGGILTTPNLDLAAHLNKSTINGPASGMRKFFRWALARRHTPDWQPGIPTDSITIVDSVDDPGFKDALFAAMAPYAPPATYVPYHYWESDDHVISEAMITLWNTNNAEYYNGFYTEVTSTHVQFWRMQDISGPFDPGPVWGDPVMFFSTPINHAAAGNTYRYFSLRDPLYPDDFVEFVYRVGSGHPDIELDVTFDFRGNMYFPLIPLRLNNIMIDDGDPRLGDLYGQVKKAFKMAYGQDVTPTLDALRENPSLDDLDFVYTVFAAPLNTPHKASKNFIYEFVDDLHKRLSANGRAFKGGSIYAGYPSYNIPRPEGGMSAWPQSMGVRWSQYGVLDGTGLAWPGATPGNVSIYMDSTGINCNIVKQLTATTWRRYTMVSFRSEVTIYNGQSIIIDAKDAFTNDGQPDEPSGFLIPVSHDVFKSMSIVQANQLTFECNHILICCYKVVKQRWYEKGFFKVLLVIAIIVVTIATGGIGATSAGLLGTNIAVGTALGFTGTAAIVAGAAANMIAGMIVSKLVMAGLTALVGDELAMIITAIAAAVTLTIGNMDALSFDAAFKALSDPALLIKVSSAVGSGVANAMAHDTADILEKTQEMLGEYRAETERLNELYSDVLGYRTVLYDALSWARVAEPYVPESLDSFLARTLMTGSDVADITMGAVSNYVRHSLDLSLE